MKFFTKKETELRLESEEGAKKYSFFNKATLYIIIGSILLIFASSAIANFYSYKHIGATVDEIKKDIYKPFLLSGYFWASFLKELGFAGVVALIVGWAIENSAKKRQVEEVQEHIDSVSKNIFNALLKRNIPEEIVDKVYDSILGKNIIRSVSNIKFRFTDLPEDSGELGKKYLLLQMTHQYTIKNITAQVHRHPLRFYSPTPPNPKLEKYVMPHSVTIAGRQLEASELEDGHEAIPDLGFESRFLHAIDVPANGSVDIRVTSQLLKERSDSENWISLLPTLSIEVEVEMDLEDIPMWHIEALHTEQLEPTSGSVGEPPYCIKRIGFKPTGVILPYQGINIWWRPAPEE